ncbi:hypothetical protein COU79_03390 [Candidatus Peregrinibacteria bacterium CG10_big_fil_rev_8_21_14_0_10_54_7]|nr:MAG: hypothetical protein COU79_03390 [Candidatus Peregrinibacteria bacterium CG10_big_fil_rev_8_21_14_0_10_54_7]
MSLDKMYLGKRRAGRRKDVLLDESDLATHAHIVGRSGMGKSWLLRQMLATDIENNDRRPDGPGLCLIDPAGDLYDFAFEKASTCKRARKRLYLIDLSQREYLPGLNYLDQPGNMDPDSQVRTVIEGIKKAFGHTETSTQIEVERYLKLLLVPFILEQFTFDEIEAFVASERFRNALLHKLWKEGKITQSVILAWQELMQYRAEERANRLRGILNREIHMVSLATISSTSKIFSQAVTTVDFKKVMDERGIVLVKLPRGGGFDRSLLDLIGIIVVDKIMQAGYQRKPNIEPYFRVYIDEFARFVSNRDIEEGLNEMRKFHVSFVLAHQFLDQLKRNDQTLYSAVKTNCNVRILFSVDDEDAEVAARSMFTEFLAEDQIQDELETQMVTPIEETRTTLSEVETTTYMESLSDAQAEGLMESSGSVVHASTGVALTYGGDPQGNFFLMPDPVATVESSSAGSAYSSQQGTSKSWTQVSTTAHGSSKAVGRTTVPFYNLIVGKQVTSRQWYNYQDKLAKLIHQIVSQDRRCAFIQVGRSAPIPFVTAKVEEADTTPAGMQIALNCAYKDNKSGLTLPEIEQQQLGRGERIRAIIEEYGIDGLPTVLSVGGAVDAEFEILEDGSSGKRIQVPSRKSRYK